ncbi:probable LRR receptor-like serine/threonine-protein kinase At3g47570 [Carya illinoinensis]|uniref:probable LRR receptor-like serine/threonine-protein kinase At3g47570 n=1 Tax=Carya illinoinensis TaxID=32201 RepID=UPI001C722E09|nr:probable LRR receptor-like serine/threonine-protein kinase At3g47570 [Carya illinoinensis]
MAAPKSFLIMLYFVCGFSIALAATPNITMDQSALLSLKAHISFDPQNHLTNNWTTNTSVCNWVGVICGSRHYRVMVLNLSFMGLVGIIPPHIGNLSFLVSLSIQNNSFHGSIPIELSHLTRLKFFHFGYNEFNGAIPSQMGSLTKLRKLFLHNNNFLGTIPPSLSNISSLQIISLGYNQLSGTIPSSIFKISSLQEIYLGSNMLYGGLSTHMFDRLPNLQYLSLSNNQLSSELPKIGNLTMLTELDLRDNNFEGRLDPEIGNLTMLKELHLTDNNFEGLIPNQIGNLKDLEVLRIGGNAFFGTIPFGIFNISTIRVISMAVNNLSGHLPSNMGLFLPKLQQLILWGNKLSGAIPNSISNASQLAIIDIGDIPKTIGGLKDLTNLSLAINRLEGSIPVSFGEMVSLEFLDLSDNILSGEIPKSLEGLHYLKYLNLSFNKLQGEIPTRGPFLNFSAAAFMSNKALCGATRLNVPPCEEGGPHKKKTTWPNMLRYVLLAIGFIMLTLTLAFAWKRWKKRNPKSLAQADLYPLVTWRRISHQQLVQAMNGFSSNNLLGEGSFGSVYHGTLSDGMNIAVKIMNMQVKGAFKSFDVECEVLRNIRHRNLVKIISICNDIDFKALVLEYMPNGNLEIWLHSQDHYLNMLQRLNIMIDIASALEYLHHGYSTTIIHCDLKPSNVLLDEEMVAHVADFGMAKLLGDRDSMMQTMTLATFGYMAPEYGSEGVVSTRGDVYSYGILLMETFTRKKPTDGMFIGEMTLKHWVDESLLTSILDIVDANLLRNEKEHAAMEDCISSVMRLALDCCAESPTQRIDIKNVSATLKKLKSKLVLHIRTS